MPISWKLLITGLALWCRLLAKAFTAFARAAGVNFLAQLMGPHFWLIIRWSRLRWMDPMQMFMLQLNSTFLFRPEHDLCMMDQVNALLLCIFLQVKMEHLSSRTTYFSAIRTASCVMLACIGRGWIAGTQCERTKLKIRPLYWFLNPCGTLYLKFSSVRRPPLQSWVENPTLLPSFEDPHV